MSMHVGRRAMVVGAIVAAALVAGSAGPVPAQKEPPKPERIVVNAAGGAVNKALREAFFTEFERRYGIRVVDTSPTDFGKLRAMVQSGNVEWTATEINEADAERAVRMNLLEPIDRSVVDFSGFPKQAAEAHPHLLTRGIYSTVLGYRTDTFAGKPHPQTWAEFWDVKRFPGPRSLRNSPVDNLEFALLADGVKPENLYPLDVDRAFRKLDEIKKHVTVWWTTGAQSAQILVDKEAVMGTAWHGRFFSAIKDGAPLAIEWGQGLIHRTPFGIPRGAKDAYWGQRFMAILAEPQAQARYANLMSYPGLHKDAIKYTDPKMLPFLPTHPDNLKKQAWANAAWWYDHGEKAAERWSRWMLAR